MKVFCGKEELTKGMHIIAPAISAKNTLPVISNFLFETMGNKIKFSSTDLDIAIQCHVKSEIIEEGSVTIPAKRFAEILRELPVEEEIEIKANEMSQINIKSGKSKFNLMGISQTEYPIIPTFPKDNNFIIKKDLFTSMLKKTIFATSRDSQRYVLNGICFIVENNIFKMVATDGRRLACVSTDKIEAEFKEKVIVPTKAVTDILKLLSTDIEAETLKIGITDNQIAVAIEEIMFFSTLIEGTFPNYEQVIPKSFDSEVKLNVSNTLTAVKQMALLANDKFSSDRAAAIRFNFSNDLLKISASMAGVGSGEVELEIDYKEKSLDINFNPVFIKDVLQNIGESYVIFKLNDSLNPTTIVPEMDKTYLCVVMPMRV
jgi:DNA polymerase-3 subunit beta